MSRTRKSAQSLADYARELGVGDAQVFEDAESIAASDAVDALWINTPNDARITPVEVTARIDCLKWARPRYVAELKKSMGDEVDYGRSPSEDYASASILYEDDEGNRLITESTTSWSYVGAGLRHEDGGPRRLRARREPRHLAPLSPELIRQR